MQGKSAPSVKACRQARIRFPPCFWRKKRLKSASEHSQQLIWCGGGSAGSKKNTSESICDVGTLVSLDIFCTQLQVGTTINNQSGTSSAACRAKAQDFLADPALAMSLFRCGNGYRNALNLILWIPLAHFGTMRLSLDCFLANALVSMCACSLAFSFFFKRRNSKFNLK